jgi:hypothetical protein
MTDAPSVAQVVRPEPFPSLAGLQQAHLALRESLATDPKGGKPADAADRVRAFIARTKSTGTILDDAAERKSAQGILDYWCIELASLPGAKGSDFVPAMLAPFERKAASTSGTAEASAAAKSGDAQARELIRLSAAARLWRDSGKKRGYLLLDNAAIGQASRFLDKDSNISDLVKASQSATRLRLLVQLAAVTIAILLIIVIGLGWYSLQKQEEAAEYADILTNQTNARLELAGNQVKAATATLQKRIDLLEKTLRANHIAVPGDSQSTETVSNDVAQAFRQGGVGTQQAYQDGFIWIGSDTATGANNLENPTTNEKVLPQNVVPNERYRVNKNLVLRAGAPARSDYTQTDSLGVVPEGTIVTALAAPEQPYQRPTGNQYWLKVRVNRSQSVFVQYFGGSKETANKLVDALRQRGYLIPGIEPTPLAKGLNEVRYYYEDDRDVAKKLAADTTAALRDLGVRGTEPTRDLDLIAKRGPRNFPGVIEVWLDLTPKTQ